MPDDMKAPADTPMVLVPRELVSFLLGEGPMDGLWFGETKPIMGGRMNAAFWWRTNLREAIDEQEALSSSPAREGDAPPRGYLVKDFADGWFWTRDASLACADGAAVWSLQRGRYETEAKPSAPSPGEGDAPVTWRKWVPHDRPPMDGEWFAARAPVGRGWETRVVHYDDKHDRLPIDHSGEMWWSVPTEWLPLADFVKAHTRPAPATPEGLREKVEIALDWLSMAEAMPVVSCEVLRYPPICQSEIDALRAILAALRQRGDDWQPIASAPTDDSRFLVGAWVDGEWYQAISHTERAGGDQLARGWNHRNGPFGGRATHWRLLPGPPAALQPQAGEGE